MVNKGKLAYRPLRVNNEPYQWFIAFALDLSPTSDLDFGPPLANSLLLQCARASDYYTAEKTDVQRIHADHHILTATYPTYKNIQELQWNNTFDSGYFLTWTKGTQATTF